MRTVWVRTRFVDDTGTHETGESLEFDDEARPEVLESLFGSKILSPDPVDTVVTPPDYVPPEDPDVEPVEEAVEHVEISDVDHGTHYDTHVASEPTPKKRSGRAPKNDEG